MSKNVTIAILTIEKLAFSQEILKAGVEYFQLSRSMLTNLGISYNVAGNSIEVSGPKQYLGVDEIRTSHTMLRHFCIGYAWALGYKDAHNYID